MNEYSLEEAAFIRKLAFDWFIDDNPSVDVLISNLENCIRNNLETAILSDDIGSKKLNLYYVKLYFKWMQIQAIKSHTFPPKYEVLSMDEICNLRIKNVVGDTVVEQVNKRIAKDRFSAFEYGLWGIKPYEEAYYKKKRQKQVQLRKFIMFTKGGNS